MDEKIATKLKRALENTPAITAYLHGSRIKSYALPESDFDVAVVVPNKRKIDVLAFTAKLNLFPRPMLENFASRGRPSVGWDFSFSGLKTAVLREVKSKPTTLPLRRTELAAQVQEAIVDVLVEKTLRAVKKFKPKSLLLAGGVAANKRLREKFQDKINNLIYEKVSFHVPPGNLCTDNATYIAAFAYYNLHPVDWKKISANPQLTITGEV